MRRKRRRENRMSAKTRAAILFTLIVVIGIGVGLLIAPPLAVEEVYCEGNVRVSQEEIIEAAKIPLGKNILLQRLSKARKRVGEIPIIDEVKTRRVFPNKIKIWVRERIPAAYLYDGEGKCVVMDLQGYILDVMEDERVAQYKEFYTPVKVEKSSEDTTKDAVDSAEEMTEPAEDMTAEQTNAQQEVVEVPEPERPYSIPFVIGLKPEKAEVGKVVNSKEREKLATVKETFQALEKAGLLSRATYMDVSDLTDVVLVVENRLEIHLGELHNMEYRSTFLATVIQEKISATEHVVMDYRTNDIYVRQPEDGKERKVPMPEEESETTEESQEEE